MSQNLGGFVERVPPGFCTGLQHDVCSDDVARVYELVSRGDIRPVSFG